MTGPQLSRLRRVTVASAAAAAMLVAACSNANDKLGGTGKATGPPIVVGMINQENTPVGSFPEIRQAAEAAVVHVNNNLDGVGGRPLRLETCVTAGTPESSRACATELVAKKPVAVLGGVDLGAAASLPVLARAAIAYIGGSPALGEELTATGAFMFTGGTATDLLGSVTYAVDTLGAKRVGALYLDLPGVLSTVVAAAPTVLRSKGITDVKLVAEKADAADFTPALKSLNSTRPDVIFVVFGAQSCARIMAASKSLGIQAAMIYPATCASDSVARAAGAAANGAYFATGYLGFDDPSPDVATWRKAGGTTSALAQAGFASVMNLRAILGEVGDPIKAEGVTARLAAAREFPGFMSHPFTCDNEQVPFLSAVCNPFVRIVRYQGDRFNDVGGGWISGADLLKFGR